MSSSAEQDQVRSLREALDRDSSESVVIKPDGSVSTAPRKGPDMDVYLIAFTDGSYKKIRAVDWKHSQWIHFTLLNGSVIRVNPENVNYMHQGIDNVPEESA